MINNFLFHLQNKGCSSHTVAAYSFDLNNFANYFALNPSATLQSWINQLQGNPASINRKIAAIKSYFRWAVKTGLLSDNPAKNLKFKRKKKRLPKFIPNMVIPEDIPVTHKIILTLLSDTGIRLNELITLTNSNVTDKQIKVIGKGNKERIIPISRKMAAMLFGLPCFSDKPGTLLFGLSRSQVQYITRKYLHCNPHTIRHSFATQLLNAGAPLLSIRDLLGHESIATTQVYTSLNIEKLKQIHERCFPKKPLLSEK